MMTLSRTEEDFCRIISRSSSTRYVPEMRCKMSSILLVVASIFVLVGGDCLQKIHDIESQTNGRPLIGGYRRLENSENNTVAVKIVSDSIKAYNERSDDTLKYKDNGNYVCYAQLVNGYKYCCGFQAKSDGCKNGGKGKDCQKETKYACSAEAYKAFTDKSATLKPESVHCTITAEP